MNRYQNKSGVSLVAAAVAAALYWGSGSVAHADEAAASATGNSSDAAGVEQVVVTARRREESLQEVPVAVSVISGETLETADVRRVTDLTSMIPNLSINSGYRQGSLWISLRGIPSVHGGEPPVSVLIDGVQVPGQDFINEELGDLSSVQVLRGPQGALYGRGAIGGAILIDTQRPTNDLTGNLTLDYGNHNDERAIGTLSGALIPDMILGRITVLARQTDGFQPNFTTGGYADGGKGINVNGRLLFELGDGWTLDLNARRQHGVDGASYEYLATDKTRYEYDSVGDVNDPNVTDDHTIYSVSAKVDKKLDYVTLTSITQSANSDSILYGDGDFSATHGIVQYNRISMKAINQDLRIATNGEGPTQWMVGAFYQARTDVDYLLETSDPLADPTQYPPGMIYANSNQHDLSHAWAAYAQVIQKLPGGFELTVAGRYDRDNRSSYDEEVPATKTGATFDEFQPSGTLKKDINQNINVYATVGRGFQSGGFNPYEDTQTLGVARLFKPETSTNYEIGAKTRWLEGALTANFAAYYTDFNNQQFFFISVTPIARDVYNIDKTRIDGVEAEITYNLAKDLTVTGSVGSSSSSILQFEGTDQFHGNSSPNSYAYTANASVQYTPRITGDVTGLAYLDWERRGPTYFDVQNDYGVGPSDTLNGRLGVSFSRYQISAYMRNITDVRFPVLFQANAAGPGVAGQLLNMPRQFGLEFKASL
jgi:iron complex outermembrane recepter protein